MTVSRAHTNTEPDKKAPSAPAAKADSPVATGRVKPRVATLSPVAVQRLGRAVGNRAMRDLLAPSPTASKAAAGAEQLVGGATERLPGAAVQRKVAGGAGAYAPSAPPMPPNPNGDPTFVRVTDDLKHATKAAKGHPASKTEAKKAADAAKAPPNDREAQAKAGQADKIAGAKRGSFDKAGFIAAVKQAIAAAAPKNLEDADKFADSGKAEGVKAQVMDKVTAGKTESAKDLVEKTREAPDPSRATEKPVTPLKPEKEVKLKSPDFAKAVPSKVPADQTSFDGPKNEVADKMAEADVSESDLQKSNEPQMMQAVEAKKQGDVHSARTPGEIRTKEADVVKRSQSATVEQGAAGVNAMSGIKKAVLSQTTAKKQDQRSKDEAKRAQIAGELNKIFDRSKADVEKILSDLDGKVDKTFSDGEAEVRRAFTAEHKSGLERFKDQRYSGVGGSLQWAADLITDLNELPAVKQIYERAKANYERGMERVISKVADVVATDMDAAKARIDRGRQEIKDWVAKQPKEIRRLANEAARGMDEKFNQLESDVDEKSSSLAEGLAERYTAALGEVNSEIEAAQAENRSLWSKAKAAVGESIEAILKLKDLFMGMLAKAAGAFKAIIADPLRFIGNFLNAVKAGFIGFVERIGDHLKKGLQGWLFGKLGEAGIDIPDKLDLPGILKMVLSILGLTWQAIRARIVRVIGPKAMEMLERTAEVFVILVKDGVGGLWRWIVDKVGDLKDMVVGQIKDFVITRIVKAGITWVIGLLNPAGALIKIIQTLISVVQWIIEKGAALVELVGTVIDSVSDIARGGMGGVAAKIEGALSRAVPIVISFLASLLGLGGIGEKIKEILETVRKPVMKAVDAVIAGALKLAGPIIRGIKKGAAWAKGKYEQGKAWVKGKARAVGEALGIVKRPFHAGGQGHTLTADTKSGEIRMASVDEPLPQKIQRWLARARQHPNPSMASDLEASITRLTSQASSAVAEIQQAKSGRSETAGKVLDRLAEVISGLIVRIGAVEPGTQQLPPTENERGIRPGLGDVTPYARPIPRDVSPPPGYQQQPGEADYRALEREHVLPVRLVSALLEAIVAGLDPDEVTASVREQIARPGPEERQFHVVLIYKTAADLKTEGLTNTDSHVIGHIKALAASGLPKDIRGGSAWAVERRGRLRSQLGQGRAYREELARIDRHNTDQAATRRRNLWGKMAGILNGRVHLTPGYVSEDHDNLKKGPRGHEAPLPGEDRIRQAAELEARDVIDILIGRLDKAGSSETTDS